MKQKNVLISMLLVATPFLSTTAFAAAPGFYVGAQAGIGKANDDDLKNIITQDYIRESQWFNNYAGSTTSSLSSNEGGFAGRLFLGYNFNRYYGIEAGYMSLANNKYESNVAYNYYVDPSFHGSYTDPVRAKAKTDAWDIVGKAYLPLKDMSESLNGVDLYAKLGVARVNHKVDYSSIVQTDVVAPPFDPSVTNFSGSSKTWCPVYGLGISYSFNKQVAIDASWTQISGKGNIGTSPTDNNYLTNVSNYSPKINMFALGVTYNFG